jgi:3-hydroxybutyryl-CoA dehydrogenase
MIDVDDISRLAIVGAGLMGHGIAQEFALAGYEVHIHDITEGKLQKAIKNIQANLKMLIEIGTVTQKQAESVMKNIHPSTELKDIVVEVDVVIEAVLENLELKQEIFQKLDQLCPKHTILASNTSTLMPNMLASTTQRPDKVLVTHYFNPPYLLPLVEIVRHKETSDETVTTIYDLLTRVGKSPVIVQKEVPGFVGNRLQYALFREALSIVEQGIATPQDVDTIVKTGFGRRYAAAGPFEIWELAGWDLILAATQYILPDLESSTGMSPVLKDKVETGDLGVKTGKGFYDWTPESAEALKQKIGQILVKIAQISQIN